MRPGTVAGLATSFLLAGWLNYIISGSMPEALAVGALAMLIYAGFVVMEP